MNGGPLAPRVDRGAHDVLVVNDDAASRYATVRVLQNAGFRTREAATGVTGMRAAGGDVSAIVLDIHLPDIDGLEMVRLLRQRPETAGIPVVHLTAAYTSNEDKVRGLDSGADAYLTHPVEPAVLVATVQALVRTRDAERAMRRSEHKFRAVYGQAPGGIALLRRDGTVLDANPMMLAFLGLPLDAVVDRPVWAFVDGAAGDDVRAWLEAPAGTEHQFAVRAPDGRITDLAWRLSRDIEPGVDLAVATDVSARRQLELQRQQLLDTERVARGAAERISRMKDELIAVLSHELRSPLNAIVGWTHVLQKIATDARVMEGVAAISRNARTQARLISDILDMSRLTTGKMHLDFDRVDPVQVVADAIAGMQDEAAQAGQRLRLDRQPVHRPVRADRARLQQIVWNLLSNAVKFSARGGEVVVELRDEPQGLRISVVDSGEGIDPEFIPLLFNRFSQSDAGSSRRRGGMGLGLSIVKQLAEAHGGTVSGWSAGRGQGARFDVFLPLAAPPAHPPAGAAAQDGAQDPADARTEGGPGALQGLRVLVVDDDPEAGAMLEMILGERGARVATAVGYDSALEALARERCDLLVSDIGMPGQDGYALMREIRRREAGSGRHLPAIALTSYSQPADVARALEAGFDLHSAKPLQPLLLMQQLGVLAAGLKQPPP